MENYHKVKKALYWVIRCLLYSNVFIAICAMAFLAQGYLLLGVEIKYDSLLCLIGAGTFFSYMLIRLAAVSRISKYEPDERWAFFLKHLKFIRIVTAISFIICVILFFTIERKVQLMLFVPAIISGIYGLPIGKKFRLRDVGVIKIFLISFVWAFVASVLPAANAGWPLISSDVFVLLLANFCLIFGITLPFDVKDMKIDAMNHVKTIPVYLGEDNTYALSMLLLFISSGLHVLLQRHMLMGAIDYSAPLLTSILLTALLIWSTKNKLKGNFIYFGLLDGMILLQFLLNWLLATSS